MAALRYAFVSTLLLLFIAHLSGADDVSFTPCEGDESRQCTIHDLRVSPCAEANQDPPKPCKLKKKKKYHIEIDYTPEFEAKNLTAGLYWATGALDILLPGMEKNACLTTPCPTTKGVKQTYTYELAIKSFFPLSTYNVKYSLTGDDSKTQYCCLILSIQVTG